MLNVVDFSHNRRYRQTDQRDIPKYGGPDRYLIIDGMPNTKVSKINKNQLRKLMVRRAKNGF
jgi:non-ribosomal peptide synthetase component E (peptide arylation enzyme)